MSDGDTDLAAKYWAGDDFARDEVRDMATYEPERFFALLPAIVAAAPSDDALGTLGAGALEDFVHLHGASFIARLEELAQRVPRLVTALSGMWLGDDADVNDRIQRLILRSAAEVAGEEAPASADVIARDVLGPRRIVVDNDSCYWTAAGSIRDQKKNVVMAAARDGGEARIVAAEVPGLVLADAGNHLVAADPDAVVVVEKRSGNVEPLARGEYGVASLCVAGGRAYWTAIAVIRTSVLTKAEPTTLLYASSPRAQFATTASALTTDGRHLYWAQIGRGEIVRATLSGDDREFVAIDEQHPRQLQTHDAFVYWATQPTSGPMQIRRVDKAGGDSETVLETAHLNAFVVDGDLVYWTDAFGGTLQRAKLRGGDHELLLSGLKDPLALRVVGGAAYTTSGRYILRLRLR
jgi:hypothetical protein